jgi:hypothetical protein
LLEIVGLWYWLASHNRILPQTTGMIESTPEDFTKTFHRECAVPRRE